MPGKTILEIPVPEQEQMLAQLRAARYGHLLALHVLLLCAAGWGPSAIAAALFCSRTSVYRVVAAYRRGHLDLGLEADGAVPPRVERVSLKRSLLALLKRAPAAFGWCRTRWSCACLAAELKARRGVALAKETVRRWLHEAGYVWKRARYAARDDDPERARKLARIRQLRETLPRKAAPFFADELDIHLLPKLGYEWMLKGTQTEVMTPGQNRKNYLAGALNFATGKLLAVVGERKNQWLFLELLRRIEQACPVAKFTKIYVVADNYGIHKTQAVAPWLARHPRFGLVFLPSYCPRANPIERVFGDVHDKCTRNHKRDVQSLREFRQKIAPGMRVSYAPAERGSKLRLNRPASGWFGWLRPAYAAAAAVVLLAVLVAVFSLGNRRADEQQAQVLQPTGESRVARPDKSPVSTPPIIANEYVTSTESGSQANNNSGNMNSATPSPPRIAPTQAHTRSPVRRDIENSSSSTATVAELNDGDRCCCIRGRGGGTSASLDA